MNDWSEVGPEDSTDFLEDLLIGDNVDEYAQELFREFIFDQSDDPSSREDAFATLVDYLWDTYEIDFEEIYDWEDYREWIEDNTP